MEDNIKSLLQQVVQIGNGEPFYCLVTAANKTWLLNKKDLCTAMSFFSPSTLSGKAIKWLLPYWRFIPFNGFCSFIKSTRLTINPKLKNLLVQLFESDNLDFSFFCGTPSVNQKITIQVSQGKTILGYCKLTDKPVIANLFSFEKEVLIELHNKGIDCVPQCMYNDRVDSFFAFVQSTKRERKSMKSICFADCHRAFLEKLYSATKLQISFDETDFASSIDYLCECSDGLSQKDKTLINNAANMIRSYYCEKTHFSMYHGDFTPWNTFITDGKLFVFDFEYARRSCPPYMDACHFISETARFELRMKPQKALDFFHLNIRQLASTIKDPDYLYVGYLLYMLSLNFKLHDGNFDTKDSGYIYWVEIINLVLSQKNNHD